MTTHHAHPAPAFADRSTGAPASAIRILAPLGRFFYALIFIVAAPGHFSSRTIQMAASHGVPVPGLSVPVAGIIALVGGLSVLFGFKTRIGAWLLVVFLVPVTLAMHNFWAVSDPGMAEIQLIMFLKNVSMLGGALLLVVFGAGPVSVDARRGEA